MDDITGFIVSVTCKGQERVAYRMANQTEYLEPGDFFVGYFWQTLESSGGIEAYITETLLIDKKSKRFKYGKEAVFQMDQVNIEIKALRGPRQNNRYLPKKYRHYETWNACER